MGCNVGEEINSIGSFRERARPKGLAHHRMNVLIVRMVCERSHLPPEVVSWSPLEWMSQGHILGVL